VVPTALSNRPSKWHWWRILESLYVALVIASNQRVIWEGIRDPTVRLPVWAGPLAAILVLVASYFWARLHIWLAKWAWRSLRRWVRRSSRNGNRRSQEFPE